VCVCVCARARACVRGGGGARACVCACTHTYMCALSSVLQKCDVGMSAIWVNSDPAKGSNVHLL
jgi:hypothetical protein